ncbi:c-type cytochrome [Nitratifractor sp.]
MRKSMSLLVAGALLLATGCGKKEEKESTSTATAPKIKVTQGVVKKVREEGQSKENSGQFYYSYNKEKNASGEESSKVRTTLDAYLHIRSPYERVQITMMIKRLSKDFIVRCSPCHDDYANGVIGPSLLDKNASFIYGRIMDFKSGKRKNVLMKELVSQIDDAKLRSIADEIAAFNQQIQQIRKGRK